MKESELNRLVTSMKLYFWDFEWLVAEWEGTRTINRGESSATPLSCFWRDWKKGLCRFFLVVNPMSSNWSNYQNDFFRKSLKFKTLSTPCVEVGFFRRKKIRKQRTQFSCRCFFPFPDFAHEAQTFARV